jgi:hypothetical protein
VAPWSHKLKDLSFTTTGQKMTQARAKDQLGQPTTNLDNTPLNEVLRKALQDARSILIREEKGGRSLFPQGIGRLSLSARSGEAEIRVEISGHGEALGQDVLTTAATKQVQIRFGANGEGVLEYAGKSVPCLGSSRIDYVKDLTVTGQIGVDKFREKYSNEFEVMMHYAILVMGSRGIYIHEGADTLADNGGESAGCIHLSEKNAKPFYDWVDGRTRIQISYPW